MTIRPDALRRVPPPAWLVVAWLAQRFVGSSRRTVWSFAASVVFTVASGLLALSAVAALRSHGTTMTPEHPERATDLVTDGPFAFSRNPIYLALAGILVAHAVARRSVTALLPAAAFVVIIDRVQIAAEERALHRRFGDSFERYRRAVPRWVGSRSCRRVTRPPARGDLPA
jgi:protein-S-isoprenylcysteine O-methyltransferase Ste14